MGGMSNPTFTQSDFIGAVQELGSRGELVFNPSVLGLSADTSITGRALTYFLRHTPGSESLLEPIMARKQVEKIEAQLQSADDFRAEHVKDFSTGELSERAKADLERAVNGFLSLHPEYVASDENKNKIFKWLRESGGTVSTSLIAEAFRSLVSSGDIQSGDAVQRGQAVTFTDYGPRPQGIPPRSDKYSFQKKISDMTAAEFAKRCAEDPTFREAVNELS
jgi:hypothetical protein